MACNLRLALMLGVSVWFKQTSAQDAVKGRHFLVAFMDHRVQDTYDPNEQSLYLYVSNPGAAAVQVTVGFYNFPSGNSTTLTLQPNATTTVPVPEDVMLKGPMKHRQSVYVTSDGDIQVQAFQEIVSQSRKSYGGTAVLPVASLSTEYMVATHCVRRHCILIVVSAEDGGKVKLTLSVGQSSDGDPGKAKYNNTPFTDGTELEESLDKGESMQLTCHRCDLTGTWINSTKPVAVFSGGDFTKVAGVQKRDMVLEQMIPSKALGQRYVLGSNYLPATGEKVKIVPVQAGTRFVYENKCYVSDTPRQVFEFYRRSDEIVEIVADRQVMVVQLIRSDNRSETPDSIMNLPVPAFQWASKYTVYVPGPDETVNSTDDTVHLCLVVPVDTVSVLPKEVTVLSQQNTSQGAYKLLTLGLGAEHLLEVTACSQNTCAPFTGFIMKSKTSRTWSVTLRDTIPDFTSNPAYVKEVNDTCTTPTTSTTPALTTFASTDTTFLSTAAEHFTIATTHTTAETENVTTAQEEQTSTATTSTTTTTLPPPRPSLPPRILCPCRCDTSSAAADPVSKAERRKMAERVSRAIHDELVTDRETLSSFVRAKTSSTDSRASSTLVGVVGIFFFVVICTIVFVSDVIGCIIHVAECRRRHLEEEEAKTEIEKEREGAGLVGSDLEEN